MTEFAKIYDPSTVESKIYADWEQSGYFAPRSGRTGRTFSIAMPPPNITGTLHTGHAIMLAIQDTLIRYHRMLGDETLWLPGTDHAAIATQSVVEKKILAEEGKTRHDMTREELLSKIREFVSHTKARISSQVRSMGSSCDWSREKYTFSEEMSHSVNEMFVRMYEDGLIHRGDRIVNWDPKLQTTVSDDEIIHEDREAKLYYIKYGPFVIATSRPETKLGDTGVAVHPSDERYTQYHGQTLDIDLAGHQISVKVVPDHHADPEFGSGAIGLTPAHSSIDFEIGEAHGLAVIPLIGEDGKMLPAAGKYAGQTILECRENFVADLEAAGQIEKIENYTQSVSISDRGKVPVEPLIKKQWFVDVNKEFQHRVTGETTTLKKLMQEAVHSKEITILPERFEKTYFHWIDNLRPWCISRQIIWGHQIPVWNCECGEEIVATSEPTECPKCKSANSKQCTVHSKNNYVFLHAYGSNSNSDFWPWLRNEFKDEDVFLSDLPDTNNPNLKKQMDFVLENANINENTTIVAHSLGCVLAMKMIAEKNLKVKKIVLVAPPLQVDKFKDGIVRQVLVDYCDWNFDFEKLQVLADEIVVLGDTNDHLIFTRDIRSIADNLNAKLIEIEAPGTHFNCKECKEILDECKSNHLTRDPDTLDTWFSSGLWTFSTLGWPDLDSADLQKFHPTTVMETGYDILFFWVARMVMMSTYALGQVPFRYVYLHGLVRDEHGQKMSKSLGNVMDPVTLIDKYGTDALRMSMLVGATPGNDLSLGEQKIESYRNFANKLWNIARFIMSQCSVLSAQCSVTPDTLAEKWVASRLQTVIRETSSDLDQMRISSAGERLYSFVWDEFADWFVETQKIESTPGFAQDLLRDILKLLHPFMPFVTEAIWAEIRKVDSSMSEYLMIADWPEADEKLIDEKSETDFELLKEMIVSIRSSRAEMKVDPVKKVPAVFIADLEIKTLLEKEKATVMRLARLSGFTATDKKPSEPSLGIPLTKLEIYLPLGEMIDIEAEKGRLSKEKESIEKYLRGIESKLSNEKFCAGAPAEVVEREQKNLAEGKEKIQKIENLLEELG